MAAKVTQTIVGKVYKAVSRSVANERGGGGAIVVHSGIVHSNDGVHLTRKVGRIEHSSAGNACAALEGTVPLSELKQSLNIK